MEERVPIGERFEGVFAVKDVEIAATDSDVLVEGGSRNVSGVGFDVEGDTMLRFPSGDGFDKEQAALEACMADAANAFVGERSFDGAGEAYAVRPCWAQFRWCDGRDTLDVLPNGFRSGVDADFACDSASGGRRCEPRFGGSEEKGENGDA